MASIPGGNDPFIGGSITRTGQANVAGGIPSANTSVGAPVGGVNPGTPFFARNNQGSNIGVPYTRLVPLGSKDGSGLGRPPRPGAVDPSEPVVVRETEDLRATTLAFILGKRSRGANDQMTMVDAAGDAVVLGATDALAFGYSYGVNAGIAPGMPGTERFQKLCSLPYLQRYFTNALWNKGIVLQGNGGVGSEGGAFGPLLAAFKTGLPRAAKSAATTRTADRAAVGPQRAGVNLLLKLGTSTLANVNDIAVAMGLPGSDLVDAAKHPLINQGIYACDIGPFLRGKGISQDMLRGTPGGEATAVGDRRVQPYHVSRCAGDELAFALFQDLLEEKGLTDWRPDGIVLSKGVNDPSDKMSDEYLEARDGQLFNMRIQGPAIATSWTGDPALEVMPLDKVFVVIVADVWWGDDTALGNLTDANGVNHGANLQAFVGKVARADGAAATTPTRAELNAYLEARNVEWKTRTIRGRIAPMNQKTLITDGDPMPADIGREAFGLKPNGASNLVDYSGGPYPTLDASIQKEKADALNDADAAASGAYLNANPGDNAGANAAGNAASNAIEKIWDDALTAAEDLWNAEKDARNVIIARNIPMDDFEKMQKDALQQDSLTKTVTRLVNFRVKLATSSQMINYSNIRFDANGQQVVPPDTDAYEFRRVQSQSRMGLRLGTNGGEYIVGGWCIGNVLDTSASRAAFPSAGTNIGVRTAPNSMALNINVNVDWWDADRMWRSFMNVEDTLTPRYVPTKVPGDGTTPALRPVNAPPDVGIRAAEKRIAAALAAGAGSRVVAVKAVLVTLGQYADANDYDQAKITFDDEWEDFEDPTRNGGGGAPNPNPYPSPALKNAAKAAAWEQYAEGLLRIVFSHALRPPPAYVAYDA